MEKELLFVIINNKEVNFSCRENDETGFITRLGDLMKNIWGA